MEETVVKLLKRPKITKSVYKIGKKGRKTLPFAIILRKNGILALVRESYKLWIAKNRIQKAPLVQKKK